jgi:8-oxo-dGTP pyrophosphatase MutT (NUDIX family)
VNVRGPGDRGAGPESGGRGGPQFIPRPAEWSPGGPAPWADVVIPDLAGVAERARGLLPAGRRGVPSPVAAEGAAPSAVLIPLYQDEDGPRVVLTRRSWNLRTHRGEVAFPGGRSDPGEDAVTTAVREAREEVGLDPALVEPLGELDHLTTVTRRAYIVPVVAWISRPPILSPNPIEVDEVLPVAVAELLRPGVFREERWGSAELSRPVYFFDLHGDTVWGATAALLRQLLALLTGSDPGGAIERDPARDIPPHGFQLGPDGLDGVV